MPKNLTRKELYELVWTKPRTTLARELGVSDVWIGKQCRAMNVPAPPPGYWASLAAGGNRKRRYVQPPLTYTVVERIQEDHQALAGQLAGFNPEDFEQPVPPAPVFGETAEQAVSRYVALVRALPHVTRRGTHAIVQKLLAEDDRLAQLERQYSWYKPQYQSAEGKKQLEALNRLLWWWTDLGFMSWSSGTRHIRMGIRCGGQHRTFEVRRTGTDDAPGHGRSKRAGNTLELWFDTGEWEQPKRKSAALSFTALDRSVLDRIAQITIADVESRFRDAMLWRHEHLGESRRWAIRRVEEAREKERQRREAEERALRASRDNLIRKAMRGIARSDQIRALVQALEPTLVGMHGLATDFSSWKMWTLAEADAVDPRARSPGELKAWLAQFNLSGPERSAE